MCWQGKLNHRTYSQPLVPLLPPDLAGAKICFTLWDELSPLFRALQFFNHILKLDTIIDIFYDCRKLFVDKVEGVLEQIHCLWIWTLVTLGVPPKTLRRKQIFEFYSGASSTYYIISLFEIRSNIASQNKEVFHFKSKIQKSFSTTLSN